MQYLTQLNRCDDATWYEIGGDYQSLIKRYVVTTRDSRAICNRPEIVGCEFTNRLRQCIVKALARAPFREDIEQLPEHRVCVLNFLRGGLNFDLRSALNIAYGLNRHTSAFMSSQRSRSLDGRWLVQEDMYRKLQIPPGALILVGDVVATGVTMGNGLGVLLDHLINIRSSIRKLVFFTIGCHKIEKILATWDARFREAFDSYQGSIAVYLEGKFKLVDSRTELTISIPGTDLVRRETLLTPEFEADQWEKPPYPLERCAIYDAGSRAFDTPHYAADVVDYWKRLAGLAKNGFTLERLLEERWPQPDYASLTSYYESRNQLWRDIPQSLLSYVYERYENRWPGLRGIATNDPAALESFCQERIQALVNSFEVLI